MLARGLHGLDSNIGRGFRERAEDAAGVEPARAVLAENFIPINVAGLQLRHRGVAAVGATERGAHAESALGEIQAVAHRAADAVVGHPAHKL